MDKYCEELKKHISWLEESLKTLSGVSQGYIIKDATGEVTDRIGRISLNPRWYQEAYKKYGRKPTKAELEEIAKDHLDNGFWEGGFFVPPFWQRNQEEEKNYEKF